MPIDMWDGYYTQFQNLSWALKIPVHTVAHVSLFEVNLHLLSILFSPVGRP